jgi:hypothetical protein
VNRFLRPEKAAFLRQPLESDAHPTFRIAFTRLGSLLTLKLLISLLPTDETAHRRAPEPWLAGDLAVLANEFTGSSSIREGSVPSAMDLILEFMPRWEIDNPPDLAHSWSRTVAMLHHLRGNDREVRALREAVLPNVEDMRFYGFDLGRIHRCDLRGVYADEAACSRGPGRRDLRRTIDRR